MATPAPPTSAQQPAAATPAPQVLRGIVKQVNMEPFHKFVDRKLPPWSPAMPTWHIFFFFCLVFDVFRFPTRKKQTDGPVISIFYEKNITLKFVVWVGLK